MTVELASKDIWADMFPLPDDVSMEPQPLSDRQMAELTALFRMARQSSEPAA